jgi:hypothetical protein
MMQWLDMFCCYEILAQKSLKTELQLKTYRVLKFQGLVYEFQGLDIK